MTRIVEWEGEPFALLVETPDGDYLVPPIVRDSDGVVVEGREVLRAVIESGATVELPVVEGATPADLADIDQRMARISEELGVPIGPPGDSEGPGTAEA